MTGLSRLGRRWPGLVLLLPALLALAACDRGSASAGAGAAGSGAEGLLWIVAHGKSLFGPDSLLGIDPGSGRVVQHFEAESLGDGLAIGEGALWATDPGSNAVLRLDLRSGRTDSIPLGEGVKPESIVIVDGAVWVGSGSDAKVRRIDPARREVVAEIRLGEDEEVDHAVRLTAGGGSIWAVEFFGDYELHRIDPATNTVAARIEDIGDGAVTVAYGEDAVWVASVHDGRVHRIDPATLEIVASPQVGRQPFGVAVGDGGVWVANRRDESVARVDPNTNRLVATIPVSGEPYWVAVAGGSVWVGAGESLVRIDPQTNQIAATMQRTGRIGDLAAPQ
jgi:YVTN family beta-propeller protein